MQKKAELAELRLLHIEGVKKDIPLDLFEENGRNNRRYGDYVVISTDPEKVIDDFVAIPEVYKVLSRGKAKH
jgi:hydrogenase maturation factor